MASLKYLTEEQKAKCMQYSEQPEQLEKLLNELCIEWTKTGSTVTEHGERNDYSVTMRLPGRADLVFEFHGSVADCALLSRDKTREQLKTLHAMGKAKKSQYTGELIATISVDKAYKEFAIDMPCSLLTCCKSECYIPGLFEDFCSEFGYEEDSRKAFDVWQKCLKHSAKVHRFFTESEIECLPS